MANKRRSVAIIGLGTLGQAVARELTRIGDRVLGVDLDDRSVANLCDEIDSSVVANASELKSMQELGLEAYDAVIVAIGENMQANILASMHALEVGCKNVWAKAQNDTHRTILERIGVHHVMVPEQTQGLHIAQLVHNPRLRSYLRLWEEMFLAEVRVPRRLFGQTLSLSDMKDRLGVTCIGLLREQAFLEPATCEKELLDGDYLLLLGNRSDIRQFADGDDV